MSVKLTEFISLLGHLPAAWVGRVSFVNQHECKILYNTLKKEDPCQCIETNSKVERDLDMDTPPQNIRKFILSLIILHEMTYDKHLVRQVDITGS